MALPPVMGSCEVGVFVSSFFNMLMEEIHLRLVVYPIFCRVLYQVVIAGFLNHQQYYTTVGFSKKVGVIVIYVLIQEVAITLTLSYTK